MDQARLQNEPIDEPGRPQPEPTISNRESVQQEIAFHFIRIALPFGVVACLISFFMAATFALTTGMLRYFGGLVASLIVGATCYVTRYVVLPRIVTLRGLSNCQLVFSAVVIFAAAIPHFEDPVAERGRVLLVTAICMAVLFREVVPYLVVVVCVMAIWFGGFRFHGLYPDHNDFRFLLITPVAAIATYLTVRTSHQQLIAAKAGERQLRLRLEQSLEKLREELNGRLASEQQRRALEQQLHQTQKIESMGALACGVAHDLNNSLSAILTYIEMCRLDRSDDAELMQTLEQMRQATMQGGDVCRQVLTYAGRAGEDRTVFDVASVVRGLRDLLRVSVPLNVMLDVFSDDDECEHSIHGDQVQIQQVVSNLVLNAGAATEPGGRIRIRTFVDDLDQATVESLTSAVDLSPGRYVGVEVRDDGCGMDGATKEKMFDPFFTTRSPPEDSTDGPIIGVSGHGGTGMGLAVVFGVVRAHGGGIACQTELGKGTSLCIYFPWVNRETQLRAPEAENIGLARVNQLRVLFVEDEDLVRQAGEQALRSMDFRVTAFSNGDDAIQAYDRSPEQFDVAIVDYSMPGINGLETISRIRQSGALPSILCSGYFVEWGEGDSAPDGFLQKPYRIKDLRDVIQRALIPNR